MPKLRPQNSKKSNACNISMNRLYFICVSATWDDFAWLLCFHQQQQPRIKQFSTTSCMDGKQLR
eukprot:1157735-Pelagomonas_calceolata.AAC.6